MEKERIRLEKKVLSNVWYEGKIMVPRAEALDILFPIPYRLFDAAEISAHQKSEYIRRGEFFE